MGGKLGDWWYGIEQEPLRFKGEPTLFFDKALALDDVLNTAFISKSNESCDVTHFYFNLNQSTFFESYGEPRFYTAVASLLRDGYHVTIDGAWKYNIPKDTDRLQKNYRDFELVLRLDVSAGTTLKIYDSNTKNTNVQFVNGVSNEFFDVGPIQKYGAGDVPGKQWLKKQKASLKRDEQANKIERVRRNATKTKTTQL